MVRLFIALLFTTVVSTVCLSHAGTRLSVRLLDANNGKPLKGVTVFLMVKDEGGKSILPSRATTNGHGIALFDLPEPTPENIEFSSSSDEIGSCSDVGFSTAQILKTGFVATNKCNLGKYKYTATPKVGEVVIFAHRIGLWKRIRREIP